MLNCLMPLCSAPRQHFHEGAMSRSFVKPQRYAFSRRHERWHWLVHLAGNARAARAAESPGEADTVTRLPDLMRAAWPDGRKEWLNGYARRCDLMVASWRVSSNAERLIDCTNAWLNRIATRPTASVTLPRLRPTLNVG